MEKKEIEAYRKAGKIASEVCKYAKGFIKPGMLLLEIAHKIEKKITELGAGFAFPINLSMNEIAAHYTPSAEDKTLAEGLLKVDIGLEIDGYIADTAFSMDLTPDKKYQKMIDENEKALQKALAIVKSGMKISEIGEAVQSYSEKSGFAVVRNLCGHTLGRNLVHGGLTLPNHRNNSEIELKDVAFAIEPFFTGGGGEVIEGSVCEIYALERDGQVRDRDSREVLKFIKENYATRPFCKRWLANNFKRVNLAIKEMLNAGLLHEYPILVERSRKPVSQSEHTVLIAGGKAEVTTA